MFYLFLETHYIIIDRYCVDAILSACARDVCLRTRMLLLLVDELKDAATRAAFEFRQRSPTASRQPASLKK